MAYRLLLLIAPLFQCYRVQSHWKKESLGRSQKSSSCLRVFHLMSNYRRGCYFPPLRGPLDGELAYKLKSFSINETSLLRDFHLAFNRQLHGC